MNENMANFRFKIAEMQRKLNIINDDIEEIKNGRKSQDETETLNKNFTYFQIKRKNFFNNNFSGDVGNYPIQKNKNDTNYLNFNYPGRMTNQIKTTNFNLTNTNLEEIPKNTYITKFDSLNFINNNAESNANDIDSKKIATINYDNDLNNNMTQKYKTSSSTINVNDKKNFENPFKKNANFKNLAVNDNFYKNSLYHNYCHIKKNLNNINLNTNNFNSSQTINNNCRWNKTFNKRIKNINSIPSLKHKKIKKIIDKRNIIKKNSNTDKNLFNTDIMQKNPNKKKKSIIFNNFLNNQERKTIDINYNNKNIYHNSNINLKSSSPVKIKVKSNNINHGNNKADFNKIKDKNNTIEDINLKNIRSQRSMSIKNPINNDSKFNRNIHQNFHEISATNIRNNYPNTEININCKDYLNTSIDNKFNHEQMLLDLIDITNQYHNRDNKVNMNNIIDEYKSLLYDFKLKNEFIYKIVDLYNNSTNSDLKYNDSESLLPTWNWIRDNQNKIANSNILNKDEDNQYKNLCEDIMKQYNLKNIQQLKKFIGKLCKKVDKNENFLEGIKKILLP